MHRIDVCPYKGKYDICKFGGPRWPFVPLWTVFEELKLATIWNTIFERDNASHGI